MTAVPLSVLDLAPVIQGGDVRQALHESQTLAVRAESYGYNRIWIAEHHGMPGIASAATSLLIARAAEATSRIRVGAGGIMLPNHSPLVIAEQFGTLETLYPGRIDLGLGRAPGSDHITARALRRGLDSDPEAFVHDVAELQGYFDEPMPGQPLVAIPGASTHVPLWILGSSLYGAQVAARLGLPYAFASHFAPRAMMSAISLYRREFQPSPQLARPYVMLGFNVFAAESDEEGHYLATSMQQAFVQLRIGRPTALPAPRADFESTLDEGARMMLAEVLACSAAGSASSVRRSIQQFVERTGADELILASHIHDPLKRLRSYEIVANAMQ